MVPVDTLQVADIQVVVDIRPAVDTLQVADIQVVVDIRPAVETLQVADIQVVVDIRPVVHILTVGHHKDWLAEVVMAGGNHHTGPADSGLDLG